MDNAKKNNGKKKHVVTVALGPELLEKARLQAVKLGFEKSFGAYVRHLIKLSVEAEGQGAEGAAAEAVPSETKDVLRALVNHLLRDKRLQRALKNREGK
ncbi:MAG: hypothetical protein DMF62_03110 [Acidobacteria bacterium]|nr:MAG: hypothetical protein DMF62_03110 [Acidobacteriota bacterium]